MSVLRGEVGSLRELRQDVFDLRSRKILVPGIARFVALRVVAAVRKGAATWDELGITFREFLSLVPRKKRVC